MLMPEVDERIDDLHHENYSIPVMLHGHRVLKMQQRDVGLDETLTLTEDYYVDARQKHVYTAPGAPFNAKLTGVQLVTLQRINRMLRSLMSGGSVSDKALRTALSPQQFSAYQSSVTDITDHIEHTYGRGMPDELRSYQQMLAAADFQYNKFEKMSALRSVGRARYKMGVVNLAERKAEHLYERALERLQEIWGTASAQEQYEIQEWMDRHIDFDRGAESELSINPVGMPRVRGSRSVNALDSGLPKLSQRLKRKECQLIALRDAAKALAFVSDAYDTQLDADAEAQRMRDAVARLRAITAKRASNED